MRGAPAARLAAAAAARTSRRVRLVFGRPKPCDSIDTPPCWLSALSLARNVAEEAAKVFAILKYRTHTKVLAAHECVPHAVAHRGACRDCVYYPHTGPYRQSP